MIITLASSFASLSNRDWEPYLPAIQHLVQAHIQGWHFFVPDRQSVAALTSHPKLAERTREILAVIIGERLSVLQGYAGTASVVIECEMPLVHSAVTRGRVRIDIGEFSDLDNCLKTKLIVENAESDGVFYTTVAKELAALGSLMPSLALEIVAGGGHTTAYRVADAVAYTRPSVTIVDSDKTHPNSAEGATATAVRLAFAAKTKPAHTLVVTQVRALENFIPYSAAQSFLKDNVAKKMACAFATWQELEKVQEIPIEQCLTAYYGPRKGLKKKDYRLSSASFRERIRAFCIQMGIPFDPPDLNDPAHDKEFAVPPLSTEYAKLFIELTCLSKELSISREYLDSPFFEHLKGIADCVVSFGAAPLKSPFAMAA